MNKRWMIFVTVCVLLFLLLYVFFGLTGFAVFIDSGLAFNNGTYANSVFNGSSVVLSGNVLQGNYTSQIFDAGALADWKNISVNFRKPSGDYLFVVDSSSSVYSSNDNGTSWNLRTSNYGDVGSGAVSMFSSFSDLRMYIVFSGSQKKIYRTNNFGVNWSLANGNIGNPGIEPGVADSNGNLYVLRSNGNVIKSNDLGVSWTEIGDINPDSATPKGLTINEEDEMFAVDADAEIWKSSDYGVTWTQQNGSFIGGGGNSGTDGIVSDDEGNLFILLNKQIWKSSDYGVTWTQITNSFTPYSNNGVHITFNNYLYVADGTGRIFSSIDGVNWTERGDVNGASSNTPKGLSPLDAQTSVTYQVRNCSSSDCAGAIFIGSDGTSNSYFTNGYNGLSLKGRYFQYKVYMSRDDILLNPDFDSVSVGYDLSASAPTVNIIYPYNGLVLGTNNSIGLNFSVSGKSGVGSCWYSLNNGANNVSIVNCMNNSFGVNDTGSYTLKVYANDSLNGLVGSNDVSFSVVLGAPLVILNSPANGAYLNKSNVAFNYTASDIDLNSCALNVYYSNGSLAFYNSTKYAVSGQSSIFNANLVEEVYSWFVSCDDFNADVGLSEGRSLNIDLTRPNVSLSAPIGTYSSLTGVPLTYSASDASPITCWYNLTYLATGGIVSGFSNLNIEGCVNLAFNIIDETNYRLYLSVNDSAGNTRYANTNFTVSVPAPSAGTGGGSGGGGGGGGGGFGGGLSGIAKVSFVDLEKVQLRQGERREFSAEVLNAGTRFLNRCSLHAEGGISPWISKNEGEVASLSSGQRVEYSFIVGVPRDTRQGDYSVSLVVECNETKGTGNLNIGVIPADFHFNMDRYERIDSDSLKVYYTLESYLDESQNVALRYSLLNPEGVVLAEGNSQISLESLAQKGLSFDILLPKDSFGEFLLEFDLSNERDSALVRENIILSRGGITGFFVSDENRDSLLKFGGVILVLLILFVLFRVFYIRHGKNKKIKTSGRDKKRR